jgi:hypothetical protein
MLPNFLIVGAARSGTSTLYRYLQSHRQIYLRANKRPEPHFFFKESEYLKGLRYYEETWFPRESSCQAVGEASTSYLFGPEVPARIAAALPKVRLIALLRNPIDRAFSSYWHSVRSGVETLDFAAAIERETERTEAIEGTALAELKPYSYVARGFYYAQISNYLRFVEREQLMLATFDELREQPARLLRGVYRHLGVAEELPSQLDVIENRSMPDGKVMDPSLRQRLIQVYADDVVRLGKFLDRDLTAWLD